MQYVTLLTNNMSVRYMVEVLKSTYSKVFLFLVSVLLLGDAKADTDPYCPSGGCQQVDGSNIANSVGTSAEGILKWAIVLVCAFVFVTSITVLIKAIIRSGETHEHTNILMTSLFCGLGIVASITISVVAWTGLSYAPAT